ncbi:hypothetical protein BGZ73_000425 [Actinomortierella ambigua]|nr:hypothetical protein BGZ73_000425 [Actinomortierella ambigua]
MRCLTSLSATTVAVALCLALTATNSVGAELAIQQHNQRAVVPGSTHINLGLTKRQDDHDHDHDHPPTTTTSASAVAPTSTAAPAPGHDDHDHDHGHDHDHDHGNEPGHIEDGHTDGPESAHSHGPARTCDPHSHDHGEYKLWQHLVTLFCLMIVAALGCVIPILLKDTKRSRFFVQMGKYFGAGVVLSVAFIHILPQALFSLTHPCLSKAWTDDYPGYAPLIMMVSGLSMLVIEYLASTMTVQIETSNAAAKKDEEHGHDDEDDHHHHHHRSHGHEHGHAEDSKKSDVTTSSLSSGHAPRDSAREEGCSHAHGLTLLQCGPGVSTKVSTYMLEVGIALHSVFIGIALGVLAGSEFVAMAIAISFHQFFEGIALGSRIADLTFKRRFLVPAMLVGAFALVTPLGMAIGLGIRSSYKADSVTNLIVMGVFDSVAAGVLLYTAFVTLLGGDILYSERFRTESRNAKAAYLLSVWLGAATMAILAIWA